MWPKLDNDEWIKGVLGSATIVNIKREYGVDVVKYDWVKDYIRDKKAREKIDKLGKEIAAVQKAPIHKDEVTSIFKESLKAIKLSVLEQLKSHLHKVQIREVELFHGLDTKILSTFALNQLSASEISEALSILETGKKKQEIEKAVEGLEGEIESLQKLIDTELSPQHRWLHFTSGHPVPYPHGCKWTIFANDWKTVALRFEGHVTIEGYPLETEHEHAAFRMLELDKVYKPSVYFHKPRKR